MKMLTDENSIKITEESSAHFFVRYKDFDEDVPMHWHSFYEFEIITEGRGRHILNGEEYEVKRGSAYLLTPTDFHTVKKLTPMKLWHLSFDEEILSEKRIFELSDGIFEKRFELDETVMKRLVSILSVLEGEAEATGGCARELCEALLSILLRGQEKNIQGSREAIGGINRALIYMNAHFRENPSLKTVAEQAGFHPNYFSELFSEVTGENYLSKLTRLKISYAKTLLKSGFSVSEACYRSGFGSLSNFLSAFKRLVGKTPTAYKSSHKSNA